MMLVVKNYLPMQETRDVGLIPELGRSPGGGHGNPLQHSCWRIPWMEEPGRLYSPWGRKESDMTERLHSHKGKDWPQGTARYPQEQENVRHFEA